MRKATHAWADTHGIEVERGYRSHKHYAGTVAVDLGVEPISSEELACLPPGGYEAPEFAMRGWVASVMAGFPPDLKVPKDLEAWQGVREDLRKSVARVIAVPEDRPAVEAETVRMFEGEGFTGEEVRYGSLGLSSFLLTPKGRTEGGKIYLHENRTKKGALRSEEVENLLASGTAMLAPDCVGMDDSGMLLVELSTMAYVQYVLEWLDFLEQRGIRDAVSVGYVDDVALYAAALDDRISGVVIGSRGGTTPHHRQRYRQEGVVAYIAPGHCHSPLTNAQTSVHESVSPDHVSPDHFRGPWESAPYEQLLKNAIEWGTGAEG